MKSPFKFLDAYELEDKDVFFGRDKEVDALYEMVFKTPLSLVYGLSGTGKTSLIQCGLAGKFDGPDWYPFWVRRNDDINVSLNLSLQSALGDHQAEKLVDKVSYLFRYYLRPIYLIFDQFEELFILGSQEEQQTFIQDIQELLTAELPCKILFIMREEYIGQLYNFEKHIPTLFDYRLRVEQMNNHRVMGVMKASFEKFNISLEGEEEARLQQMIDNISGGKSRIQLPYLQVYLDMLYREDYRKTYKDKKIDDELPPLVFTESEISEMGQIDDVLDKFLERQEAEIQKSLEEQFENYPEEGVKKVLDAFATESGTKRPMSYKLHGETIVFDEAYQRFFPKIDPLALSETIKQFERNRILRGNEESYELAHDSLASVVDQNRSDEQRQLNEIRTRISSAYREFQETKEYLSQRQLLSMDEYLPKIPLEDHLQEFVEASKNEVQRIKQEADQEHERELAEQRERAETEQKLRHEAVKNSQRASKNARRANLFSVLATIVMIVAVGFLVYAINQNSITHETLGKKYQSEEKYDLAIEEYTRASELSWFRGIINYNKEPVDFPKIIADLKELSGKYNRYSAIMDTATSYQAEGAAGNTAGYQKALQKYEEAKSVGYKIDIVENKLSDLRRIIAIEFSKCIRKGDAFKEAGGEMGIKDAREAYIQALDLGYQNSRAKRKLNSLPQE